MDIKTVKGFDDSSAGKYLIAFLRILIFAATVSGIFAAMYLGYEYYQRETINKSLLEKAYKIIENKETIVAAEEGIALRHVLSPDMEYCLVEFHDGIKKIELNVRDKNPNLCYIGKKSRFVYEVIPHYDDEGNVSYRFVYGSVF